MDWQLFREWLIAIGTSGAVIVALFSRIIRKWWNRPKIFLYAPDRKPCVDIRKRETLSSDEGKEIIFRVNVKNTGRNNARNALLVVDTIYKSRPGDTQFLKEDISPIQLRDSFNMTPNIIASKLDYYYNLASVHRFDEMVSEQDKASSKVFYKLYLQGGKQTMVLGTGTFIIPIKVYSSDINVATFYVELTWKSDVFSENKQDYCMRVLSNKEFKSIKLR